MASSSVTVNAGEAQIRKYGGTRGVVRGLYSKYKKMTLEEFLTEHQYCTPEHYESMTVQIKLNKN